MREFPGLKLIRHSFFLCLLTLVFTGNVQVCFAQAKPVRLTYRHMPTYPLSQFPYYSVLFGGIHGDNSGILSNHILGLLARQSSIQIIRPKPDDKKLGMLLKIQNHNQDGLKKISSLTQAQTFLTANLNFSMRENRLIAGFSIDLIHLESGLSLYSGRFEFESVNQLKENPQPEDLLKIQKQVADYFRDSVTMDWYMVDVTVSQNWDQAVEKIAPGSYHAGLVRQPLRGIKALMKSKMNLERQLFQSPDRKDLKSLYTKVLIHLGFMHEMKGDLKIAKSLYELASRHMSNSDQALNEHMKRVNRRIKNHSALFDLLKVLGN